MSGASEQAMERQLRDLFGADASCEGPLSPSGAGLRLTGVDLRPQLTPEQVGFLLDALSRFGIVTMPGQDLDAFSLAHFERFANHWALPFRTPTISCAAARGRSPMETATGRLSGFRSSGAERRR